MTKTKHFKKTILAGALGASMSITSWAAPLEKELNTLLSTHPLLKAAAYTVDSAESSKDAAVAGYAPRLFVDATYGKEYIENRAYDDPERVTNDSVKGDISTAKTDYSSGTLRIEQPLLHFGRISSAVDAAESGLRAQEFEYEQATQRILLEGITAYLQVGRYVTLIELAKQNEASTKEQLDLESKRVDAGGGIEVDALQAKTRLQVVRERSVFYRQQLRDVLATYEQLFGRTPELSTIQDVGIPLELIPDDAESAITEYMKLNPSVNSAFAAADQAFAQIGISDASILPKIDAVGRANAERTKNSTYSKDEWSVGLRFSWTLSLGGEELHRAKASLSSHDASLQQAVAAQNNFKQQVRTSWNQVENGQERLELLADAVEISKSVMQDRKRLRDAGKETALAALDAEVEYYGVLANKVNAEFDTRIAAYRLLAALGALSPEKLGLPEGKLAVPVSTLVTDADQI